MIGRIENSRTQRDVQKEGRPFAFSLFVDWEIVIVNFLDEALRVEKIIATGKGHQAQRCCYQV